MTNRLGAVSGAMIDAAIPNTILKLATEFARLMRRDLTKTQMKKVNTLNAKRKDICASHDFIDANMTMDEAFKNAVGREPNIGGDTEDSQADIKLWNDAWQTAIDAKFFVEAK